MRENRPSGSEGGGAGQPVPPTPIKTRLRLQAASFNRDPTGSGKRQRTPLQHPRSPLGRG